MDRSTGKLISYIGILLLICVCAFLLAKYMVRRGINENDVPIDTSTRM